MAQRLASIDEAAREIWRELECAVLDRQHAWRTPVLATVNGDMADARTVILREVDQRQKQLTFYTDERAGKVTQLRRHPLATMVMWSPKLAWQLRCRVVLTVEMGGLATTSRWARVMLTPAAQDYLAPFPPGTPLDGQHHAPGLDPAKPTHFAVVSAQVLSIDWLELHPQGHRRALIDDQGMRWVQP